MNRPAEPTEAHWGQMQLHWRQFWLLFWKNGLLQKKKIGLSILLILYPIPWSFGLVILRSITPNKFKSNGTTYDSFLVTTNLTDLKIPPEKLMLAYAPNTTLVAGIVNRTATLLGINISSDLGFATENALENYTKTNETIFGAIVFVGSDYLESLPKTITYKIRLRSDKKIFSSWSDVRQMIQWNTNIVYPEVITIQPIENRSAVYKDEGFLAIQKAVDLSLIAEVNKSFDPATMNVTTQLKQFPLPPYHAGDLALLFRKELSLFVLLSFGVLQSTICGEIVLEKENKFKELLKLMGMRMWVYWSSWLAKYLIFSLISVAIMMYLYTAPISANGALFANSSSSVIFVFLMLYSVAMITFSFAITTLVSKATYGAVLGIIVFFLSDIPYLYLMVVYDELTLGKKLAASLVFNVAMGFGWIKISQFESIGIGLQWNNIWSSETVGDDLTMGYILIMLCVDIVIYSMITWYLDAVIAGEFGTTQPFNFLFKKEYWVGRKKNKVQTLDDDFMTLVPESRRPYFEAAVTEAKAEIQIRGLTKDFGKKANPAVNNLNIDIYKGSITVLLGHNGAGKTTTMFMLIGSLPPSTGTASVNGFDIRREMDQIRQNLGLCPQHNILYDQLSVGEHLIFFAVLKGSSFKKAKLEMTEMVKLLDIEKMVDEKTKTLSGGQKRKLSVGIALIAGSKFVILDEPTSGMDPESRRQTWDILQKQRKDRTMILSTHYMDEADLLGDRIAIMSSGEIQCYGTPMFLKNKYGVGYHLTIVKTSTCDVDQLLNVIKSHIATAYMLSNEAKEITFLLPSNQSSEFQGLFETLETDGETLGIDIFGVSTTTMEDVFLRVKDSSALEGGKRTSVSADAEQLGSPSHAVMLYKRETSWRRHLLQLRAMIYKRMIHSRRNYALTLFQILIPVLFAIIYCAKNLPTPNYNFPPLTFDLTSFKSPITPYDIRNQTKNAQRLSTCYNASVSRQSTSFFINSIPKYSSMDDYLQSIGKDHEDQYNWNYQIGATIDEESDGKLSLIGFFSNQAYHTIAISLSFMGNTLMQCFGNKEYQIKTINHPLPVNRSLLKEVVISHEVNVVLYFSFTVSFGLNILIASFIVFLIKERTSGAKHSQLVSGIRLHNFWLGTIIWDYVNYLIPCILILVVILSFQTDGYGQNSWVIFIGLMLYGFSILPFVYMMSCLFREASLGFICLLGICVLTGFGTFISIARLKFLSNPTALHIVEWIFYVFFSTFCFIAVFDNINSNYNSHKRCAQLLAEGMKLSEFCSKLKRHGHTNYCCPDNCGDDCEIADNYLSWTSPGVGRPLVFMVLQGIVFFLVLCHIESDTVRRRLKKPNKVSQSMLTKMNDDTEEKISEDLDVAKERQRIQSNPIQELVKTNSVVTQDLTKLYGNFVAVNQLSIGVSQKECFGLLGVNGAGKTTTFKMLTGEIRPSYGSAYVAGISVLDDLAQVHQKIGYCAQFDSIIDQMTVQETLWMYACAHGIPPHSSKQVIERLIDHVTLNADANTRAGNLSGGNKRKLCVAVALIGNPTVVFLDEPTTGVDPEARRHIWNTLTAARSAGTTIVLSSHSMEECEAICTRMGILVNGRFLCLGNLQHLRDKFSDGYTLIVKLQRSATTEKPEELQEWIDKLKTFIGQTFPESVLKDHHENLLTYQVKTKIFKWSEIFGIMEKAKVTYEIEDYSVGQTTLEQLFIQFARLQRESQEISKKKCCGCCYEE